MKKDGLLIGLARARLPGSFKTQANDCAGVKRFISTLRNAGEEVQKWKNLNRGHVTNVVETWKQEGLSAGTIKNYMSSVRKVCGQYGNVKIERMTNKQLGIANRVYVDNRDKSVPEDVYREAVERLAKGTRNQQAVGLILEVARTYGARLEEAYKFWPARDLGPTDTVTISRGTKGGRERTFNLNERQQELADRVATHAGRKGNLIPDGWSEKSWRQYVYTETRNAGIGRNQCGASVHGLRHARLHELYESICGFKPPVKYNNSAEFVAAAQAVAGNGWKDLDGHASRQVTLQAGHGADRYVFTQYLGSWRCR